MSDRHEKWVPVEPGTVIPAGQPYRVEMRVIPADPYWTETATECVRGCEGWATPTPNATWGTGPPDPKLATFVHGGPLALTLTTGNQHERPAV